MSPDAPLGGDVGDGPGVFVGVLVGGGPGGVSAMSSNQMSPVGLASVIRRSVRLVFEPLPHVPLTNCQEPAAEVHKVSSPMMSFMSMHALPTVLVRQR